MVCADVPTGGGESFMIGDTVWIDGLKRGRVAYIGDTQFAKGEWVGICLDAPEGNLTVFRQRN